MVKLIKRTDKKENISYGITLPKIKIEQLGWQPGDDLDVNLTNDSNGLVIIKVKKD